MSQLYFHMKIIIKNFRTSVNNLNKKKHLLIKNSLMYFANNKFSYNYKKC